MTAGCHYDNASFVDEEEQRRPRQKSHQHKQQQQQLQPPQQLPNEDNCGAGNKPTLLTLSRSSSVRYRPVSSDVNRDGFIGDLLVKQIDQQRQSEPPLSRNPSVRYSRRFPPTPAFKASGARGDSGATGRTGRVTMTCDVEVHSAGGSASG